MTGLDNIKNVFLIGIGGIGMSAVARWFLAGGFRVAGYDRTGSSITDALAAEGSAVTFDDDIISVPEIFRNSRTVSETLVVYTPAIPAENKIISWYRENGYRLVKRSDVLGMVSSEADTLAVSGTHGKTTVSTLLAHILRESGIDCSAFLGGISKNYDSNLLIGESNFTVMEADEFDRSFHRLSPHSAIVTSVDADHLDIYGDHAAMIEGYNEFFRRIRNGGFLVFKKSIEHQITIPAGLRTCSYSIDGEADFSAGGIRIEGEDYLFDLITPAGRFTDVRFSFPGRVNVENAVAASALAMLCGAKEDGIRSGLLTFRGVKRRFDIRINRPGLTYIDDYAHHPEEIKACITSVREYFGDRKITGIFQPHLFTRTSDHAEGFARILDLLDEVIILPVYPAREKPIPGVTSSIIFDRMKLGNKRLLEKRDIPGSLDLKNIDVLLTIGAGDIDRLAGPIEDALNNVR